jgi:hypothetical protein
MRHFSNLSTGNRWPTPFYLTVLPTELELCVLIVVPYLRRYLYFYPIVVFIIESVYELSSFKAAHICTYVSGVTCISSNCDCCSMSNRQKWNERMKETWCYAKMSTAKIADSKNFNFQARHGHQNVEDTTNCLPCTNLTYLYHLAITWHLQWAPNSYSCRMESNIVDIVIVKLAIWKSTIWKSTFRKLTFWKLTFRKLTFWKLTFWKSTLKRSARFV